MFKRRRICTEDINLRINTYGSSVNTSRELVLHPLPLPPRSTLIRLCEPETPPLPSESIPTCLLDRCQRDFIEPLTIGPILINSIFCYGCFATAPGYLAIAAAVGEHSSLPPSPRLPCSIFLLARTSTNYQSHPAVFVRHVAAAYRPSLSHSRSAFLRTL